MYWLFRDKVSSQKMEWAVRVTMGRYSSQIYAANKAIYYTNNIDTLLSNLAIIRNTVT